MRSSLSTLYILLYVPSTYTTTVCHCIPTSPVTHLTLPLRHYKKKNRSITHLDTLLLSLTHCYHAIPTVTTVIHSSTFTCMYLLTHVHNRSCHSVFHHCLSLARAPHTYPASTTALFLLLKGVQEDKERERERAVGAQGRRERERRQDKTRVERRRRKRRERFI